MIPDPATLTLLRSAVARLFGVVPKSPTDFNLLAADIFARTGRTIGVSTLKRIWGYVTVTHGVSFSTLSILCRYIGFADWDAFVSNPAESTVTSGFSPQTVIATATLPVGTTLLLKWLPDKSCTIRKTAQPETFIVIDTANIKLRVADRLEIDSLAVGRPFFVRECYRDGLSLGTYTGALHAGLLSIHEL